MAEAIRPPVGIGTRSDVTWLVTTFIVLLFALPASLVVGPLGGLGAPAALFSLGLTVLWLLGRLNPGLGLAHATHPVGVFLGVWVLAIVLGWLTAFMRPLEAIEASGSDRVALLLIGMAGMAAFVADGLRSVDEVEHVLRRLLQAGAFLGLIGVLQFVGLDLAARIQVPGLVAQDEFFGVLERANLNRPASTTLHPIEYSVVAAMLLPLALARVLRHRPDDPQWLPAGIVTALIAASIVITVSRSGILAGGVAVVILATRWTWRRRLNLAVLAVLFLSFMRLGVPGLLGTLRDLFLNAGDDPSIMARTSDVAIVAGFFRDDPLLGRGIGTYTTELYTLLDNQLYKSLIEIGVVGLFCLLLLLGGTIAIGVRIARRAASREVRHLALTLTAAIAAGSIGTATFDSFFYRVYTGVLFLLIGCMGALWRLAPTEGSAGASRGRGERDRTLVGDGAVR